MGKSYKKTPVCKDKNNKYMKRLANKQIRKKKDISNGKMYKKNLCSYDICDYRSYQSYKMFQEYKKKPKKWFMHDVTEEEWYRWYKRK